MAVEKMQMMNLVSHVENLNKILRELVLTKNIHLVNAMDEIDQSNFTLSMHEENLNEIINMCDIQSSSCQFDYEVTESKIVELMEKMEMPLTVDEDILHGDYNINKVVDNFNWVYKQFESINQKINEFEQEKEILDEMNQLAIMKNINVDFKEIYQLKNFDVKFGTLTYENKVKLSKNYENISAAVFHIGDTDSKRVYISISPTDLKKETNRILKSVYFEPIEIKEELLGTPEEIENNINKRLRTIKIELSKYKERALNFKTLHGQEIKNAYSRLIMEKKLQSIKNKIAVTKSFFYLSAWVPNSKVEMIRKKLNRYKHEVITSFSVIKKESKTIKPPTKLRNNWLLRPFELLVKMYGIPSYTEIDPTLFLGITYMFLFGAMFGDLGQGLLLMCAGFFIILKSQKKLYGELLVRLGLSSSIFGFFYDSFFGYEHIISHTFERAFSKKISQLIFIRPIENIDTILSLSIGVGIVLLMISYGYSIVNKLKKKDIQEGFFGRNGVAGLILFVALLIRVASVVLPNPIISHHVLYGVIIIMVALMVLKEPLTALLTNKRPFYHVPVGEYYVESGFDILETFLSLLSNSVSFIRVGAFALNHVGLFIAFHTMGNMIGTISGEILMFIIGNLLVIFLEGLIVFIQGLRLVYYELFSKYYEGDGEEFSPLRIEHEEIGG